MSTNQERSQVQLKIVVANVALDVHGETLQNMLITVSKQIAANFNLKNGHSNINVI